MTANTICEAPAENVRVVRFLRPDVRAALYDRDPVEESSLYKEILAGGIEPLPRGGTLVLNFGLIDWFPTAFYGLLLRTLQDVRAKGGHIAVCCLSPNVKEGFDLMGGGKLFDAHGTEAKAIAAAKK
jgi:anti-anti-sigma factor